MKIYPLVWDCIELSFFFYFQSVSFSPLYIIYNDNCHIRQVLYGNRRSNQAQNSIHEAKRKWSWNDIVTIRKAKLISSYDSDHLICPGSNIFHHWWKNLYLIWIAFRFDKIVIYCYPIQQTLSMWMQTYFICFMCLCISRCLPFGQVRTVSAVRFKRSNVILYFSSSSDVQNFRECFGIILTIK